MKRLWRVGGLVGIAGAAAAGLYTDWNATDFQAPGSGRAVTLSSGGDLFVAGSRSLTGVGIAPVIWKFSPLGTLYFTRSLFGTIGDARAVTPDSAGGVVAGGTVLTNTATGTDAWLARIDQFGATVWLSTFHGSVAGDNTIDGAAMTPAGLVAVTGRQGATLWVALISATGGTFSQYVFFNPLLHEDVGRAVAVDPAGNVYVAGSVTKVTAQGKDLWVGKFSPTAPALTLQWSITLNGAGSATDYGTGIALDPLGNLMVTGALTGLQGTTDMLVANIANGSTALADGTIIWSRTIDGGEQDHDEANAVTMDAGGYAYVTGAVDRFGGGFQNIWIAKFGPGGSTIWETDIASIANDDDRGRGIVVDALGAIFITGDVTDQLAGPVMVTERLRDFTPAPAISVTSPTPVAVPNPFRPGHGGPQDAAGITFGPLTGGSVMRLYTLAGSLVAELNDSDGNGLIVWNAKTPDGTNVVSGVYVYAIAPPTGTVFRGKVVIIR